MQDNIGSYQSLGKAHTISPSTHCQTSKFYLESNHQVLSKRGECPCYHNKTDLNRVLKCPS